MTRLIKKFVTSFALVTVCLAALPINAVAAQKVPLCLGQQALVAAASVAVSTARANVNYDANHGASSAQLLADFAAFDNAESLLTSATLALSACRNSG